MSKKVKVTDVAELARHVTDNSALFNDERSPFYAHCDVNDPKLVVLTGENASGKSLFVRVMAAIAGQDDDLTPVSISIRERTGAGSDGMGGMRRIFMFGDEKDQSTGATSVQTIQSAFEHNLDRPSILILDEPEIGLSEGYTRALGEYIGQQAQKIPRECRGVIVVSHCRPLVVSLIEGYNAIPTHVHVAPEPIPPRFHLTKWLAADEHRSVEDLLSLREVAHDRWKQTRAILKEF